MRGFKLARIFYDVHSEGKMEASTALLQVGYVLFMNTLANLLLGKEEKLEEFSSRVLFIETADEVAGTKSRTLPSDQKHYYCLLECLLIVAAFCTFHLPVFDGETSTRWQWATSKLCLTIMLFVDGALVSGAVSVLRFVHVL